MKTEYQKFMIVGLFAVAMGFLEAIVVVYLREIYYPDGFSFPLTPIEPRIYGIELVRELSTLVMLITVGLLAGRTKHEKFAWFLYTFGVWDITYYIGLKFFLDWPASLLTWDILFLIPVTWVGPVLAPVICSATMILFTVVIVHLCRQLKTGIRIGRISWLLIILGAVFIFISFIQDYTALLIREGFFSGEQEWTSRNLESITLTFIPEKFNWWLFGLGEATILWAIFRVFLQNRKTLVKKR
ncbi:MAG: hypothetical protein GXO86_08180 [Chlorobi bacterium]|nr:hypothetical protein [Chlorobiota bacterium]